MFQRRREAQLTLPKGREGRLLRVVADAAIGAGPIGDGRLIPLIIVDTTERPDLDELLRVHGSLGPGDVDMQWGTARSTKNVILILQFIRPVQLGAVIEFDVRKYLCVIDQILHVRAVYLQAGREGDRFIKNMDAAKILIEVPDIGFRPLWEPMFQRYLVAKMREEGLARGPAKRAAREYIEKWREFRDLRM